MTAKKTKRKVTKKDQQIRKIGHREMASTGVSFYSTGLGLVTMADRYMPASRKASDVNRILLAHRAESYYRYLHEERSRPWWDRNKAHQVGFWMGAIQEIRETALQFLDPVDVVRLREYMASLPDMYK